MTKSHKTTDLDDAPKTGDDSMRESYHFTHTIGVGDVGVGTKLEEYDEVESEEKVHSYLLLFAFPLQLFKISKISLSHIT